MLDKRRIQWHSPWRWARRDLTGTTRIHRRPSSVPRRSALRCLLHEAAHAQLPVVAPLYDDGPSVDDETWPLLAVCSPKDQVFPARHMAHESYTLFNINTLRKILGKEDTKNITLEHVNDGKFASVLLDPTASGLATVRQGNLQTPKLSKS